MCFGLTFFVDKDIIKVDNNKDIEFLSQDLVDVSLKRDWGVSRAKKHDQVLKVIIAGSESHVLFIVPLNSHLIVCMS